MSGKQYLKNQLAVILINLLGMLALALFLIASGNNIQTVLFILVVWLLVLASCLLFFFFTRKKALDRLLNMAEQLEERYLLPEIMQEPERADEQVFYQIMKMAEKSMVWTSHTRSNHRFHDCDCLLYSNCFSRDFSIYRIESFNVADRDDCRNISAITNLLFHQYMDTL